MLFFDGDGSSLTCILIPDMYTDKEGADIYGKRITFHTTKSSIFSIKFNCLKPSGWNAAGPKNELNHVLEIVSMIWA